MHHKYNRTHNTLLLLHIIISDISITVTVMINDIIDALIMRQLCSQWTPSNIYVCRECIKFAR